MNIFHLLRLVANKVKRLEEIEAEFKPKEQMPHGFSGCTLPDINASDYINSIHQEAENMHVDMVRTQADLIEQLKRQTDY